MFSYSVIAATSRYNWRQLFLSQDYWYSKCYKYLYKQVLANLICHFRKLNHNNRINHAKEVVQNNPACEACQSKSIYNKKKRRRPYKINKACHNCVLCIYTSHDQALKWYAIIMIKNYSL